MAVIGGRHTYHSSSVCASHSTDPGSILGISKREFDVAECNRRPWFEESGQWLENVD